MHWFEALILGLVEGLTEFVPVSSTGHLILVNRALGLGADRYKAFNIVIQLGALLAAVIYYRGTLLQMARGLLGQERRGGKDEAAAARRLFLALCIAALPALSIGYLFGKTIKARLFGPVPVAGALIVGGAVMIGVELWQRRRPALMTDLGKITPAQAIVVGLCQAAALWPGTSRSMASIVGAQLAGLSTAAAADFAFLLAIPTLGAATLYELFKSRHELLQDSGGVPLAIGLGVSFVVGWLVIAAFLRFLRRFGLQAFGYYRIALGALVLAILL